MPPPPIGRRLPVAASRRVRRPGAWSRVSVPRRAAHRSRGAAPRGTSSGCECASPSPAPRGRRQRSNVDRPARPSGPVRGTVESRYTRGAPATGSGTPAPQGGRDRTRRFILHRFTFESVRAIRYCFHDCFVPLAPRRAAGHSRAASAGMERGPPRPANTRRETERAECQSERSEKCLQIAVKRGKGWTLECASFLR